MFVDHLVYYLIHQEGMEWRDQDYRAHHIVKCVKNEQFNGSFTVKLKSDRDATFSYATRAQFLTAMWPYIARKISESLNDAKASIVPRPNSVALVKTAEEYRTLSYARAIAQHSDGRLTAVDALRWRVAQDPQHKISGRRDPEVRFANMQLIKVPTAPVVLFDDFITSGASLIAGYWHLAAAGVHPVRAYVIGRRTDVQHPKMTEWGSEDLEIPGRQSEFF